jgi:hypothetical protein
MTTLPTPEMTAEGTIVLGDSMHKEQLDVVANRVWSAMEAKRPAPPPAGSNIIFAPSLADGTLNAFHNKSLSGTGSAVDCIAVPATGVPIPPSGNRNVLRAKIAGSGSGFARVHVQHEDIPTPLWVEGTDIWYAASFFLPTGYYSRKTTTNDIMRWDAYYGSGYEQQMQGGLGIGTDRGLYIMSNYPYVRVIDTPFSLPENKWSRVEVHQVLSESAAKAKTEIYVDGQLQGISTTPNYKSATLYPPPRNEINRLRIGIVSEGDVSDSNTLYVDRVVISKVRVP